MDGRLERLFQEALCVSQEAEDAFWADFRARCRHDEQAWVAFGDVMLRQTAQVQAAVIPERKVSTAVATSSAPLGPMTPAAWTLVGSAKGRPSTSPASRRASDTG